MGHVVTPCRIAAFLGRPISRCNSIRMWCRPRPFRSPAGAGPDLSDKY